MHVNLLPHDFRAKMLVRRRSRQWSVAWAACALAVLAVVSLKYRHVAASKAQAMLAEMQCQPTREIERETRALETETAALSRKQPVSQGVEQVQRVLGLMGELGRGVEQSAGKLQLMQLDLRSGLEEPRAAAPGQPAAPAAASPVMKSDVILHGAALDDDAVAQLMSHLRAGRRLDGLKLKGYSARPTPQGVVRDYQIEGRL